MDLIEKYGSCDAAKAKQQELSRMAADPRLLFVGNIIKEIGEIEIGLLEYRRQHNIFDVGDWIIVDSYKPEYQFYQITKDDVGSHWINLVEFRHATDEEIKAGKRLEVKSDS